MYKNVFNYNSFLKFLMTKRFLYLKKLVFKACHIRVWLLEPTAQLGYSDNTCSHKSFKANKRNDLMCAINREKIRRIYIKSKNERRRC